MVAEGFYGNRSDFIRTAIRHQLNSHAEVVKQVVARKMLVLGLHHFSADDLRALKASRQKLQIRVLGLATIADDVSPELALAAIESIDVLGALHASGSQGRPGLSTTLTPPLNPSPPTPPRIA